MKDIELSGWDNDDVVDTGSVRRRASLWTAVLIACTVMTVIISGYWGAISSLPDKAADWAFSPVTATLTSDSGGNSEPLAYAEAVKSDTAEIDQATTTTEAESDFDFTLGDDQTVEEACKSFEPVFSDCMPSQTTQTCQLPDGTQISCAEPTPSVQPAPTTTDAEQVCNAEHGQIVCVPADDSFGTQPISCTPTGNLTFPKADDWTLTCQLDDESMLRIVKSDWYMLFIYHDPYRTIELSVYKESSSTIQMWDRQDSSDRSYMIVNDDAYRNNCELEFVNGARDISQSCTVLIDALHDFKIYRTIDTETGGAKRVSVRVKVVDQAWGYFSYGVGELAPSSVSLTQDGGYVPN